MALSWGQRMLSHVLAQPPWRRSWPRATPLACIWHLEKVVLGRSCPLLGPRDRRRPAASKRRDCVHRRATTANKGVRCCSTPSVPAARQPPPLGVCSFYTNDRLKRCAAAKQHSQAALAMALSPAASCTHGDDRQTSREYPLYCCDHVLVRCRAAPKHPLRRRGRCARPAAAQRTRSAGACATLPGAIRALSTLIVGRCHAGHSSDAVR